MRTIQVWNLELLTPTGIKDLKFGFCRERNLIWVRRDLYPLFQGWREGKYVNTSRKVRGELKEIHGS